MNEGVYISEATLLVCLGMLASAALLWKVLASFLGPDRWEYGWCRSNHARRDRNTREVQFLLWKPGEQGWAKGMWVNFGDGHKDDFFPWEMGSVILPHMVTHKMKEEFFKGKS